MRGLVAVVTAGALALAGCGGGDERQDADEPEGQFKLSITSAQFEREQSLAKRETMRIAVRNDDSREIPNVNVTVATAAPNGKAATAFGQASQQTGLADANRPIWIVDRGPVGGETAYVNTWALGRLAPGQSKTFEWRVTPVKPGRYTITYEANPGLDGKAKIAAGSKANGTFVVAVAGEPSDARVGENGEVVRIDSDDESGE